MRFRKIGTIGIALVLAAAVFVFADEGMWMPHQMKDLDLKAKGLRMDPADLYKTDGTGLMSAVVNLGGGTGEFVSADGLILTNHHVAFGAVQRASSKEKDYITNGFTALTREQEIPAQGYTADVLLGYEDVTVAVLGKLEQGLTPRQRYDALERITKEMVAKAEKDGKDLRCTVATMYSGNKYYLFKYKRIRDVRLVLAPPQALGNFGGEVDNWMWPRHTCDFSFLRAYVAKDGTGAEYSSENVPYKPLSILKISLEGFKPGDLTFVMGYPGRTSRNATLAEVRSEMASMAKRIKDMQDNIAFFENAGRSDKEVEIRYASRVKGTYNGLKNFQGKLEGMQKIDLVGKKAAQEKEFLGWAAADPDRQKKYGRELNDIAAYVARADAFSAKNEALSGAAASSTLLSQAYSITRAVQELQKPDKDREPQFQDRNMSYVRMSIQLAERGYDFATDRAFMKHNFRKMLALPAGQVPAALKGVVKPGNEAGIDAYVDGLYAKTVLAVPGKRLELLALKPARLAAVGDPLIGLAAELEKEMKVVREEAKAIGQERLDLRKVYEEALLERAQGRFAPDANGTIRFTYGPVEGYSPKDAVYYEPQTTLTGVIEKETGAYPFAVPDRIKKLRAEKDFGPYMDARLQDVPACFLNTTNVTGGNSGSPTFNAKGEQIGIIFDMTYESVIGDYFIIPELQRSISVDIRWVLFVTDKFAGASSIIREIGF
ncbi:MAG TPA: S46 family peptidase [Acidobacteriota bacterium]|nr:S46 family peptidase [Acidobacteriota bacterium]